MDEWANQHSAIDPSTDQDPKIDESGNQHSGINRRADQHAW
jgi:hypothetical protein